MVSWATLLREILRIYEQLLINARVEVYAGLSHQRWRILHGELPPRLRARAVVVHLTMQIAAIRAGMLAVDKFKTLLVGMLIEPAKGARKAGAK